MVSDADGERAVRLARGALERALHARSTVPAAVPAGPPFDEPRGVFVTLRTYPAHDLRGCIGFPLPVYPLHRAIAEAAVAAGEEDPRFRPVRGPELAHLVVEVSVLTPPEPIVAATPAATVAQVRVGRDGLIVEGFGSSGLLLPQVAPEQHWTAEEFLDGTCEKAGLPAGSWRDPRVRVRRFEAEVFEETAPGGPVARERLTPE